MLIAKHYLIILNGIVSLLHKTKIRFTFITLKCLVTISYFVLSETVMREGVLFHDTGSFVVNYAATR